MKKSKLSAIREAISFQYVSLVVLFCLAIATSYMTIGYLAKYATGTGETAGARVAKFDFQFSEPYPELSSDQSVDPDLTDDIINKGHVYIPLRVINPGEVAVRYKFTVKLPEPLPSGCYLLMQKMSDFQPTEFKLVNSSGDNLTYETEFYTLGPGEGGTSVAHYYECRQHVLQVYVPGDEVAIERQTLSDIVVDCYVEQID